MDLGLAQLADEAEGRLTRTRQFVGTLRYASPEQVLAAGRVDRRSDVYSLGATLWELLTLRPSSGPTDETPTPELMRKITRRPTPSGPRKHHPRDPRDLEAIVLKCLEKDRARRYATAAELATDLDRLLRDEPVTPQPLTFRYWAGKLARRHRWPITAATTAILVLMAGLAVEFQRIKTSRDQARASASQVRQANVRAADSPGKGRGARPPRQSEPAMRQRPLTWKSWKPIDRSRRTTTSSRRPSRTSRKVAARRRRVDMQRRLTEPRPRQSTTSSLMTCSRR